MEYLQSYGKINMIPKGMRGYPWDSQQQEAVTNLSSKSAIDGYFHFKIHFRDVTECFNVYNYVKLNCFGSQRKGKR